MLHLVCHGFWRVLGVVLDFAHGHCVVGQHRASQTGHLVGNQCQAPAPVFDPALEGLRISGQRIEQKGALQCHVDDLPAQFFQRAQSHEGHRHFLQIGNVFLEVLERVAQLQCEQPA